MTHYATFRFALTIVAALGVTSVLALLATAQPGPVTQGGTDSAPATVAPASGLLSPDAVSAYLQQQNHKVNMTKGTDGRPILLVQIQKDGWKYDIEIEFQPNLRGFFLSCPLGKAGAPISAAQLGELLRANYKYTPDYFLIRGDNRLALETNTGAQMNTATFQAILNRFLGNVRASQAVWDSSRWPANSGTGIATGPSGTMSAPK
jgi:hypothetical protein